MPNADVHGQNQRLQPFLDTKEAIRTLSSGDRGVGSCEISMIALIKSWKASEKRGDGEKEVSEWTTLNLLKEEAPSGSIKKETDLSGSSSLGRLGSLDVVRDLLVVLACNESRRKGTRMRRFQVSPPSFLPSRRSIEPAYVLARHARHITG